MNYGDGVEALLAGLLDDGAPQSRLEQLARMTAAKYWRSRGEDWGRRATIIFRPDLKYVYAVFPIWRGRYYVAVKADREDTFAHQTAIRSDMFDVVAVTTLESQALQLACQGAADEVEGYT